MRRLVYYIACTTDGFISRDDGSFDFFPMDPEYLADLSAEFPETVPGHARKALGVSGENRHFEVVLMGRNTYEVGVAIGVTNPYPHMKQYVFSRTLSQSPDENVELVSGDPAALVRELKAQEGKDIWLCGGGALASALFPEIDEMILKVNPVILGSGIPLFSGGAPLTYLDLVESKVHPNGFMRLRYRLKR